MKTIVVPIKQILDPSGIMIRRDRERIFINRRDYIIDPASKAAIEAALRLGDATAEVEPDGGSAEIIAISMGEPRADDALREALALGCDRAVLLSDRAFEKADVAVTARVLAAGIEKLGGAELILCGRESGDTGAGQMGPRLAALLGYSQVTEAYALLAVDGCLQVTRRWSGGYAAVQAKLPVVVTVAPEAFQPRYAHGARIMNAYQRWEVTPWDAADLGLDPSSLAPLLEFRGESFPPPLEVGEVFRGEPEDVAREAIAALKMQRLIQ
jgi:electron transfer flavoprotein beta subunit